jgi:hypothetical protein
VSRLPNNIAKAVEKVIMPSPPNCISSNITDWPKIEKKLPVSFTTRPVTHTALVLVKSASINEMGWPKFVDTGRHKRSAPIKLAARKLTTIIWLGFILTIVIVF